MSATASRAVALMQTDLLGRRGRWDVTHPEQCSSSDARLHFRASTEAGAIACAAACLQLCSRTRSRM